MLGRIVNIRKYITPWVSRKKVTHGCAHMQTHIYTYNHMHILFLRVWWPLNMCVWVFPWRCSLHTTSPSTGWSRGTQDGMSVKAWEREGEKLGLFPQAWVMAPCSQQRALHRGMAPRWVEQTHAQTHMNKIHTTTHVRAHNITYLHKQYTIHQDIDILCLQVCEFIYDFTALRNSSKAKTKKQCCPNKLIFGHQRKGKYISH